MGNILVRQSVSGFVAKNPASGSAVQRKFFEINPPEIIEISDFNEVLSGFFSVAAGEVDYELSMGTVGAGKILFIKPEQDVELKIENAEGITQAIKVAGGRQSIMHIEFISLSLTNSGETPITGSYCVVGD